MRLTDADKDIVLNMFRELFAHFPAWRQYLSSENDAEAIVMAWADAIVDAGINRPEILSKGVRRASKRFKTPFMPSPQQFIECCKPSADELGFPDAHKAMCEAINGFASRMWGNCHPIAYHAWQRVPDKFNFSQLDQIRALKLWEPIYQKAVDDAVNGRIDFTQTPPEKRVGQSERPKRKSQIKDGIDALNKIRSMIDEDDA